MTPREFYENRFEQLSFFDTVNYTSGMSVGITGIISKSDLTEEDLILLTACWTAHQGGMMDGQLYNELKAHIVLHNPACRWHSTMDERLAEIDRMKGRSTVDKVSGIVKRDAESIGYIREKIYRHVIGPLMRTTNSDPDILYLQELCKRLPRNVGSAMASRSTSPF